MNKLFRLSAANLALVFVGASVAALALFAAALWYTWSHTIGSGREAVLASDADRMAAIYRRDGMNVLHRTLAGYTRHVNFGGVLMIGLGCEVNQLTLYGQSGAGASKRHFNIQDAGGSRRAVERAMGR